MSLTTEVIIDGAFLEVCPSRDAVDWLKRSRENANETSFILRDDNKYQEEILHLRGDGYINFGLARYGVNAEVARKIYDGRNLGLRCTLLANFPGGGFDPIYDHFLLHTSIPTDAQELCALFSNSTLSDGTLEKLLKRSPPFDFLGDELFEAVLIALAKNPRMSRPYDAISLDGWSEYTYHNVFTLAWGLTKTLPATPRWASVLNYFLADCLPPIGFDPTPIIARWYFPTNASDGIDPGYFLRSRLADLIAADRKLLGSPDAALRTSFYRRFKPVDFPSWFEFAKSDSDKFLDSALHNSNLWAREEDRYILSRLAWDYPDPRSDMSMINSFRAVERRMRESHPAWFA